MSPKVVSHVPGLYKVKEAVRDMEAGQSVTKGSEPQNSPVRKWRERRQDENARPEPQEPREECERRGEREAMQEPANSQGAGIVPCEKVVGSLIGHVKAECKCGDEPGQAESRCRASINHEVL